MSDPNREYLNRWHHLDTEFLPWLNMYKYVTDYLLPRRGYYLDRDGDPTEKAVWNSNIVNDAATRAIRILGAGMQGGLSSENRKWFRLGLIDDDFAAWGPVKEWLDKTEAVCYRLLSGSNYYATNHMLYEEQAGFGTGCMFFERDPKSYIRFRLSTAGEGRFALGAGGRTDTIYRKLKRTAKQIVEAFGLNNCSDSIKQAYNKTPYKYFEVIHVVEPRGNRDRTKGDPINMPVKSVWFEYHDNKRRLGESGYRDIPAVIPTWSMVRNSPYGLGPGHDVLGHVLQLQEMEKASVKGLHRQTDPPMAFPAILKDMISLLPGSDNYVDIVSKDSLVGPLYDVRVNLQDIEYKIGAIERKIERTCYNDLFLLIASQDQQGDMTATEILERHEEKLLLLGPTIERQIDDNLAPTISWVVDVAVDEGLTPPPPEGVTREQLKTKFIGPLAQAQQLIDAQSINTNLTLWERMIGLGDDAIMALNASVDFVETVSKMERATSLPSGIIRSKDEAEARLMEMQQQLADQATSEQEMQSAEMAKALGQANTGEGTALADLKSSMEVG